MQEEGRKSLHGESGFSLESPPGIDAIPAHGKADAGYPLDKKRPPTARYFFFVQPQKLLLPAGAVYASRFCCPDRDRTRNSTAR